MGGHTKNGSKSNNSGRTGATGCSQSLMPRVSGLLWKIALKADTAPKRNTAEKKQPRPPVKFTDEQILEMRTLHEFEHWPPKRICEKFGCDYTWLLRVLDYTTRSKLIPKRPTKS